MIDSCRRLNGMAKTCVGRLDIAVNRGLQSKSAPYIGLYRSYVLNWQGFDVTLVHDSRR